MRSVLAITLLLASGCFNPDELIPFTGNVIARAHSEGQPVRLLRARSDDLNQCDSSTAEAFRETSARAGGEYAFELFRIEAQSLSFDKAFCFRVETTFPSGSRAFADRSQRVQQDLRFPPLREWVSNLELDGGTVVFEPVIPWPVDPVLTLTSRERGVALSHQLTLTTPDGGLVWRADDHFSSFDAGLVTFERVPFVIREEVLEDFSATLRVQAALDEGERRRENLYELPLGTSMIDPERTLDVRGQRPPLSRGLACTPSTPPCPLTDGRLDPVDAGFERAFEIDLGEPRPVRTVVVRGATFIGRELVLQLDGTPAGRFEIRSSSWPRTGNDFLFFPDGGSGPTNTGFVLFELDGGVEARRVKLEAPQGFVSLTELSAF